MRVRQVDVATRESRTIVQGERRDWVIDTEWVG